MKTQQKKMKQEAVVIRAEGGHRPGMPGMCDAMRKPSAEDEFVLGMMTVYLAMMSALGGVAVLLTTGSKWGMGFLVLCVVGLLRGARHVARSAEGGEPRPSAGDEGEQEEWEVGE